MNSSPEIKDEPHLDGIKDVINTLHMPQSSGAKEQPDTTGAMNEEEDDETRLLRKERIVEVGLQFLDKLASIIRPYITSIPECRHYLEQIEEIQNRGVMPQISVGVIGPTGAGKSSLINALLGHEMLVSTNGMRASTSVVVEISWNKSEDPAELYTAEIEFVTEDEWWEEFDILAKDITNRPNNEQLNSNASTDASIAASKICAVYPGLSIDRILEMTQDELNKYSDILDIIDCPKKVSETTPKGFLKAIGPYIDSRNKGSRDDGIQFSYWPLVKVVKVYIKAEILRHGLVLVDLPGLGDSSSARANVTETYIKNLHHLWIVSDIVRSIDNQIAKDLMGRSFKRQLLMDGKYDGNFVTFVMTKTDQITIDECINNLGLDTDVLKGEVETERQLREDLERALREAEKHKQKQKDIKKRQKTQKGRQATHESDTLNKKRKYSEIDEENKDQEDLTLLLSQAVEAERASRQRGALIKKELAKLNIQMKRICIKERNKYTQEHLSWDFKSGRGELEDELLDGEDSHKSSAKGGFGTAPSMDNLQTFCISSKASQKLSGRLKRDAPMPEFKCMGDTQIPQLRQFAIRCTFTERERISDSLRIDTSLLLVSIKAWAQHGQSGPELTALQRELLLKALAKQMAILKKVAAKNVTYTMSNIRRAIKNNVEQRMNQAVTAGSNEANDFGKKMLTEEIACGTWKAICRRNGARYSTNKQKVYHWNRSLLDPFLKTLTVPWREVFREKIPALHKNFSDQIIESLLNFRYAMEEKVSEICGDSGIMFMRILSQIPQLDDQLRQKVASAMRTGQSHAQTAHRKIEKPVLESMRSYYESASQEKGTGVLKRLRHVLVEYLQLHSNGMFEAAAIDVTKEFNIMTKLLSKKMSAAAKSTREKIERDFSEVMKVADESQNNSLDLQSAKRKLQVGVGALIQQLEEALETASEKSISARDPFEEVEDKDLAAGGSDSDSECEENDGTDKEEDFDDDLSEISDYEKEKSDTGSDDDYED